MSDETIRIEGALDLQRALERLPVKIEANIVRGALRAGAKVIEREAKALAPARSGKLRASIRISTRRKRSGLVQALVKAGGRGANAAYYAHFVERGTRPHDIPPGKRKALLIEGKFRETVRHPGARAVQYMRRAFDARAADAVRAIADYIRKRLAREVKG